VGWAVAQHLLAQCGVRPPLVTMTVDTFRADQELLVVAADGSAARGDRAPRVGIPGQPLDDRIMASLTGGRLSGLGGISDTEAARVGCTDAAVWRALAALGDDWVSETARQEHPLGVTYFVARLRRGSRSW
jgi:hypothetical protein